MIYTVNQTVQLEEITCGTCGIIYAAPANWIIERRKIAGDIHCPNGCRRVWTESDADRLTKQLAQTQVELREALCAKLKQEQQLEAEREAKARLEKKLGRVANGVCPCCKRSFRDLARHMKSKHPKGAV